MINTGWICPRCQKVHAPFVQGCDCKPVGQIGTPLPRFPVETLPTIYPIPSMLHPMPICGCTGPCGNAACPHRPVVTCGPNISTTGGTA